MYQEDRYIGTNNRCSGYYNGMAGVFCLHQDYARSGFGCNSCCVQATNCVRDGHSQADVFVPIPHLRTGHTLTDEVVHICHKHGRRQLHHLRQWPLQITCRQNWRWINTSAPLVCGIQSRTTNKLVSKEHSSRKKANADNPNVWTIARRRDKEYWIEGKRDLARLSWLTACPPFAYKGAIKYKTDMQNKTCNWEAACALRADAEKIKATRNTV